MIINQQILDDLTAQAKASPRLHMNLDLRNSPEDQSQQMLNAIEPGSPLPIHRHRKSLETVVCLRGRFYSAIHVTGRTIGQMRGEMNLYWNTDLRRNHLI